MLLGPELPVKVSSKADPIIPSKPDKVSPVASPPTTTTGFVDRSILTPDEDKEYETLSTPGPPSKISPLPPPSISSFPSPP
jgi:hypothetical protein